MWLPFQHKAQGSTYMKSNAVCNYWYFSFWRMGQQANKSELDCLCRTHLYIPGLDHLRQRGFLWWLCWVLTHAFWDRVCKHIRIAFTHALNGLANAICVKCPDGFIKLCCGHCCVEEMLDHLPLVWYNVFAVSCICPMTLQHSNPRYQQNSRKKINKHKDKHTHHTSNLQSPKSPPILSSAVPVLVEPEIDQFLTLLSPVHWLVKVYIPLEPYIQYRDKGWVLTERWYQEKDQ